MTKAISKAKIEQILAGHTDGMAAATIARQMDLDGTGAALTILGIIRAVKEQTERDYQKGLYDGLIAAHQNSNGRTPAPDSPAGKRMVAQALVRDGEVIEQVTDEQRQDFDIEAFLNRTRYGG